MDEQRVDIKLSKEILRWAAIEAAKVGISRRQYLSGMIKQYSLMLQSGAIDNNLFELGLIDITCPKKGGEIKTSTFKIE